MSENTFALPSQITSATRGWIDGKIRREVSAAVADDKFLQSIVDNYPTDLAASVKSALSGAVKTYVSGRTVGGHTATPADAARASKFVSLAWLRVGLTRVAEVDTDALPHVTLPSGVKRDALSVVVNGEGGKPLAAFRKSVMDAAKAGNWKDIPSIVGSAKAETPQESAKKETESADESNAADEPVKVGSGTDARTLGLLLREVAKSVAASAAQYDDTDAEYLLDGLAEVEAAIHSHTVATVAA